jgi:hypothetical protein
LAQQTPCPQGTSDPQCGAASRQGVEDALTAIREAINLVERHYLGDAVSYVEFIEPPGGVDALLVFLRDGVLAARIERERKIGRYRD